MPSPQNQGISNTALHLVAVVLGVARMLVVPAAPPSSVPNTRASRRHKHAHLVAVLVVVGVARMLVVPADAAALSPRGSVLVVVLLVVVLLSGMRLIAMVMVLMPHVIMTSVFMTGVVVTGVIVAGFGLAGGFGSGCFGSCHSAAVLALDVEGGVHALSALAEDGLDVHQSVLAGAHLRTQSTSIRCQQLGTRRILRLDS